MRCAGVILAGGESRRMGMDKAGLRLGTDTLLARSLRRMRAVAAPVAVSLAPGQATPELPADVETVRDAEAHQGPLLGLLHAMRHLEGRAEGMLVTPVDMPFLDETWLRRLADGLSAAPAVLYEWEGFANALVAGYRLALLPKAERLVAEGRRRPMALVDGEPATVLRAETLIADPDAPSPMMDVDTPEAYRAVLAAEGLAEPGGVPVVLRWTGPRAPALLPLQARTAAGALALAIRVWPPERDTLTRLRETGRPTLERDGRRSAVAWDASLAPDDVLILEG